MRKILLLPRTLIIVTILMMWDCQICLSILTDQKKSKSRTFKYKVARIYLTCSRIAQLARKRKRRRKRLKTQEKQRTRKMSRKTQWMLKKLKIVMKNQDQHQGPIVLYRLSLLARLPKRILRLSLLSPNQTAKMKKTT
jgi:hypothetical protein